MSFSALFSIHFTLHISPQMLDHSWVRKPSWVPSIYPPQMIVWYGLIYVSDGISSLHLLKHAKIWRRADFSHVCGMWLCYHPIPLFDLLVVQLLQKFPFSFSNRICMLYTLHLKLRKNKQDREWDIREKENLHGSSTTQVTVVSGISSLSLGLSTPTVDSNTTCYGWQVASNNHESSQDLQSLWTPPIFQWNRIML